MSAFALDALIFCHLQKCSETQAEFMAEVLDALGLAMEELKFLSAYAKAVLTMEQELLTEAVNLRPANIGKQAFTYYARLMGENAVKIMTVTTMEELHEIANGKKGDSHIDYLTLDNEDGYEFVHGEIITFRHCHFSCKNPLKFGNFAKVNFEDCTFNDFKTETIIFDNVAEAAFLRCAFTNCIKEYKNDRTSDWSSLGGVIKCNHGEIIDIDSCSFVNCGGSNSANYYRSGIISDGYIRTCVDSVFQNCWHYHNKTEKDPGDFRRTLFYNIEHHENNKVIASAELLYRG
jgi:hypothetical protein